MKRFLSRIYYSFPVQLLLLHFKKFQVLLVFWYFLFSAVNGSLLKGFGVDSLYLAPEYQGSVSWLSVSFMGVATGIFIMSWNITTFILFSRHFKFLATTTNPFLKYCINNALLPLIFLTFYFIKATRYDINKELLLWDEILVLAAGFLVGLASLLAVSFYYFFRADKTIASRIVPVLSDPALFQEEFTEDAVPMQNNSRLIKVRSYINAVFSVKAVRDVSHYSDTFIDKVFSRHHFAAVIAIFIALLFLFVIGFFLDNSIFQLPAAASVTVFFAILVAVAGAFSYFLQSWSVPFFLMLIVLFNLLYKYEVIDPTNKAYGLNYNKNIKRPEYNRQSLLQLCTPEKIETDKKQMIEVLENWKRKQLSERPLLYLISTSGGGTRSATFTLNVLQQLDSISGGTIMHKTFLITGASGGMLGAAYFRELALSRMSDSTLHLQDRKYVDNISKDLLNPMLSSFVARDLASPAQKFKVGDYTYIKDRGYAFEQKLSENTGGLLNKQLKNMAADERNAKVPLMLFNSVVISDGRKMILSTLPVSFLMRPIYDTANAPYIDPDAIDFAAMFANQDPMNLRMLTALRMNATFPYILPNVWLPSTPVIDVMDAGLRDNFGQESALRFLFVFKDWIRENTSGVVLIQVRDRKNGGWEQPYESKKVTDVFTKPLLLLQNNWHKMQEYNQNDLLSLSMHAFEGKLLKLAFEYVPKQQEVPAALNFHLTRREKQDIFESLGTPGNKKMFEQFRATLEPQHSTYKPEKLVVKGR
ncbi:MAG: patatin-like phospholipase family protein [Chitinophagaceae bacterium]|nr:patatin-like phospholipase family protein [Chitinophagaceae bacterium]